MSISMLKCENIVYTYDIPQWLKDFVGQLFCKAPDSEPSVLLSIQLAFNEEGDRRVRVTMELYPFRTVETFVQGGHIEAFLGFKGFDTATVTLTHYTMPRLEQSWTSRTSIWDSKGRAEENLTRLYPKALALEGKLQYITAGEGEALNDPDLESGKSRPVVVEGYAMIPVENPVPVPKVMAVLKGNITCTYPLLKLQACRH